MNSYIAKLNLIYVGICLAMLLLLFPIYKEIESQQEDEIQNILMPDCPYCELRELFIKEGAAALERHLSNDPKWIYFKFVDANEIEQVSPSPWLTGEVKEAASLISPDRRYVTYSINPSAGKKVSLVYLDLDSYLIVEEHLSEAQNTIDEVAAKVNSSLSLALLISLLILLLFLALTLYISRKIYKKINDISVISETIKNTGDLSNRIPIDNDNNEFNRLAKQLNGMFETVEHKVNDIRNISNTLAHELKTPLTQLSHQIEALHIPHEEYLILRDSAQKANDVFNSILRIAHLESGSARIIKTPENIEDILSDAIELLTPLSELKNQHIHIDIEPATANVDKRLISQAVINLLDNAIKYSPDDAEINIYSRVNKQKLVISISNTGTVVPQDELHELKHRFKRGASTRENDGLGLGLALVEAIAVAHNGSLTLASAKNKFEANLTVIV